MRDRETVELGPAPEGAPLEQQGFGWRNDFGTGNADDTTTSGLEVIWSTKPTKWTNGMVFFSAPSPFLLSPGADISQTT